MKLIQLEYFCAVCQAGGITAAARQLFVSEPTVSVAIRELENEYGIELFRREKKRLILTDEGRIFYDRARSMLLHAAELDKELRDLAEKHHPVRVGTSPVSSISVFMPVFLAFRTEHPEIKLEMLEAGSTESMNDLENRRTDCAIVVENARAREHFECIPLLECPMMFCAGKSHRLAGRERVHIPDLADSNLILPTPAGYTTGNIIMRAFEAEGIVPKIIFSSRNLAYQIEYLRRDSTACTIAMADFGKLNPGIISIPLEPPLTATVSYICLPSGERTTEAALFDRFVKERAKKILETGM